MYQILEDIKSALETVGASSVKLGIEDGISADDTPFIRITPTINEAKEFNFEDLEFEVYIGTDILDELAATYQEHLTFVAKIKEVLHLNQFGSGVCYFQRTIFDKDALKNFKVSAMKFLIKDMRES